VIEHANRCFEQSEGRIWWGRLADRGEKTLANIRKKRSRAGGIPILWVKREGLIHLFSEEEMKGRDLASKSGIWLDSSVALKVLEYVALTLPGVVRVKFVGEWKVKEVQPVSSWCAPLGPTSPTVARWVNEWVRAWLPGVGSVADGSEIKPEQVAELFRAAYQEYQKVKKEEDVAEPEEI
jgi:hypothetical protein